MPNHRDSGLQTRRGFALVITVLMLALLVLTLVTLALLVRVETSMAQNHLRQSQAQQNAMFGLRRAIGELQRHAGNDQSIPAPAGVDPLTPLDGTRYWTGVWERGATEPIWLVSGNEDGGTGFAPTATGAATIELVGEHSAGAAVAEHVEVPLIDIESSPGELSGRYGWWVGDEGVKARINISDPFEGSPAGSPEFFWRHLAPQRVGTEHVARSVDTGANEDFWFNRAIPDQAAIGRALVPNQSAFTEPTGPDHLALANRFHDVTGFSRGLLTNPVAGGLKQDLTPLVSFFPVGSAQEADFQAYLSLVNSPISPSESPTFNLIRSWAELGRNSNGLNAVVPPRIYDPATHIHGIQPVLVRAHLFLGASYTDVAEPGNDPLRIHMMPVFVLWNPTNISLAPAEYQLEAELPSGCSIGFLAGEGTTFVTNETFAVPTFFRFRVENLEFKPGECRVLSLSAENSWVEYSSSTSYLLSPQFNQQHALYVDHPDSTVTFSGGSPIVGLNFSRPTGSRVSFNAAFGGGAGAVLIQDIPDAAAINNLSRNAVAIAASTVTVPPPILYYSAMIAHGWTLSRANTSSWATINYGSLAIANWVGTTTDDPSEPTRQRTFTGPSWRRTQGGRTTIALLDQPRRDSPILSLGRIAQMKTGGDPSVPASLVWAPRRFFDAYPSIHRLNTTIAESLWDRYFFSGIPLGLAPADLDDPDFRLPNSRMRVYRPSGASPPVNELVYEATGDDPITRSAAHLIVDGAFNVNSQSVDAWRAVLASYAGVPVINNDTGLTETGGSLASAVSFPLGGQFIKTTGNQSAQEAPWRGYRRLTSGEVNVLANSIVAEVASRHASLGRPFRTMMEFVDSGVLSDAINAAGLNSTLAGSLAGPPTALNVPGWISHWDLLAALDPILTVRSDTFRIRAYGEAVNPIRTNDDGTPLVEGRAWCEAIVQRLPEYVDQTANPNAWEPATGRNLTYGRRFRVVHFRWLTPRDI